MDLGEEAGGDNKCWTYFLSRVETSPGIKKSPLVSGGVINRDKRPTQLFVPVRATNRDKRPLFCPGWCLQPR